MLKNLKKLRLENKITQLQLANAIGVSQQSVNKYENHGAEPDIAIMILIAEFFRTSLDYLVGHTDIKHKIEPVTTYDLNKDEEHLYNYYRSLTPKGRNCIIEVARNLAEKSLG